MLKDEYKSLIEKIVYLKTDPELLKRIVTAYKVTKHETSYELTCGTFISWHYLFEFTDDLESLKEHKKTGFAN